MTDSSPEWFVYIVECSDGSLYTGIARNVQHRLQQHNSGQGARYTRARRPVQLRYQERVDSHSAALIREHELKKLSRSEKLQLIKATF